MRKLSSSQLSDVVQLRITGHSIPEISRLTGVAKTTVQRHVLDVSVPPKYKILLREKQGGSKQRAVGLRLNVAADVASLIGSISNRDKMMLLVGLYWGEGTKNDFSIINSDVTLLKVYLACLDELRIARSRLRAGVRIFAGMNALHAKAYWARALSIPLAQFTQVEVVPGRKKGKLPYGMCRVRVSRGVRERLFLQLTMQYIGKTI